MVVLLRRAWYAISYGGTEYAKNAFEKKDVILLNRAWLVLMITQLGCLVSHIIHNLQRSAVMTAIFIAMLCSVEYFIRKGRLNAAKISAIAVINVNTIVMGVFFGVQSHVIDFLLLTALLPLYFFEIRNKALVFWGVAISIVPFTLYHYVAQPYITGYAMPMAEQMMMFKATTWEKIISLSILVYLIYHKNANYEKEMQEKEAQIIEQKKLYECILDQIPIDIVTFDKQLKFSYINSTAVSDPALRQNLIGKTTEQYFEERGLDMKIAQDRDKALHQALEKETSVEFEETVVDRNNKIRHSVKGTSPIYSKDKQELLCLVGYSIDITAIKEAEQKLKEYAVELERRNEDLHHFVNATSHDLKTPLRNIASYLQLIERKNKGKLDADSLSMMDFTINSVKHLNQLISDIYQYSVADRNEKPAEITDLNQVLEGILLDMEIVINEKNASVQFSHLPTVKASAAHLGMIFSNLVGNALKYNNADHPRVNIDCSFTTDEYIFSVRDNGIGIAKDYCKQVFEIFKRLHTSEEYEGTGVGLAICNKIVENYGGKIWVESEEGKGSTFFFTLSRALVDPQASTAHKIISYKKFAIAS